MSYQLIEYDNLPIFTGVKASKSVIFKERIKKITNLNYTKGLLELEPFYYYNPKENGMNSDKNNKPVLLHKLNMYYQISNSISKYLSQNEFNKIIEVKNCICSQSIEHKFLVRDDNTNKVYVIGCVCIVKWLVALKKHIKNNNNNPILLNKIKKKIERYKEVKKHFKNLCISCEKVKKNKEFEKTKFIYRVCEDCSNKFMKVHNYVIQSGKFKNYHLHQIFYLKEGQEYIKFLEKLDEDNKLKKTELLEILAKFNYYKYYRKIFKFKDLKKELKRI